MPTPRATSLARLIHANNPNLDWISTKNLILTGGIYNEKLGLKIISGKSIRAIHEKGKGSLTCED